MNNTIETSNLTSNEENVTVEKKKTRATVKKETRRVRVPLEDQKRLITVKQEEGYAYRLVNDIDNRIREFLEYGYEIVDRNGHGIEEFDKRIQDSTWRQSAVSQHVGQGVIAYLMRKPQDWYDEDQKVKQDAITTREKSRNLAKGENSKDYYGEIKIDHK